MEIVLVIKRPIFLHLTATSGGSGVQGGLDMCSAKRHALNKYGRCYVRFDNPLIQKTPSPTSTFRPAILSAWTEHCSVTCEGCATNPPLAPMAAISRFSDIANKTPGWAGYQVTAESKGHCPRLPNIQVDLRSTTTTTIPSSCIARPMGS